MQLQKLSDISLLNETKNLVSREREILTEVLHHLREIERRRLFASLKYGSLHEYATRELGYSDDQAYRRIAAMRLLKDIPELESKIVDGSLTLANISLASSVIRAESKAAGKAAPVERKIELLEAVVGKSRREAERAVQKISILPPEELRPESIRQVNDHIDIRLVAKASLEEKIREAKNILAHSHPNISTSELFEVLCDKLIQETAQMRSVEKIQAPQSKSASTSKRRPLRRHISIQLKRKIWARANSKCENCMSTRALEFDHIKPVSLGGSDKIENLRLLCRTCNQRAAIKNLGIHKMERHLSPDLARGFSAAPNLSSISGSISIRGNKTQTLRNRLALRK